MTDIVPFEDDSFLVADEPAFEGQREPTFRPTLVLDSGTDDTQTPGKFLLNDVPTDSLQLVFISARETRSLYAAEYGSTAEDGKTVVCRSCDGLEGFGSAEQGNVASMDFGPQQCAVDESGKRKNVCKLAMKFTCRPCNDYLVMGILPDGELWVPMFYHTRGLNVRPASAAYSSCKMKSTLTVKTRESDGIKVRTPPYLFAVMVSATKNKNRTGYTAQYSQPTFVDQASIDQIMEFAQGPARLVWDAETASLRALMLATGEMANG